MLNLGDRPSVTQISRSKHLLERIYSFTNRAHFWNFSGSKKVFKKLKI